MRLFCPAFDDGAIIPQKYTCDGTSVSPQLYLYDIPDGVESLVLFMDDSDIPQEIQEQMDIEVFDHWVVYNIPATTTMIQEGEDVGTLGQSSRGTSAYVGPCPPTGYQPTEHRYVFHLFALDNSLDVLAGATKEEIQNLIEGHILAQTEYTGRYDRTVQPKSDTE